jgi:hypothetical protein
MIWAVNPETVMDDGYGLPRVGPVGFVPLTVIAAELVKLTAAWLARGRAIRARVITIAGSGNAFNQPRKPAPPRKVNICYFLMNRGRQDDSEACVVDAIGGAKFETLGRAAEHAVHQPRAATRHALGIIRRLDGHDRVRD